MSAVYVVLRMYGSKDLSIRVLPSRLRAAHAMSKLALDVGESAADRHQVLSLAAKYAESSERFGCVKLDNGAEYVVAEERLGNDTESE